MTDWAKARAIPTVAVTDIKQGKRFYGNTIGLQPADIPGGPDGHLYFRCGDSYLCVYERPEPAASKATTFALSVDDVEATVAQLRQKGIQFEDYDLPEMGIKTRNGIASMDHFQTAWFTDPWGNVIALDNGIALSQKMPVPAGRN